MKIDRVELVGGTVKEKPGDNCPANQQQATDNNTPTRYEFHGPNHWIRVGDEKRRLETQKNKPISNKAVSTGAPTKPMKQGMHSKNNQQVNILQRLLYAFNQAVTHSSATDTQPLAPSDENENKTDENQQGIHQPEASQKSGIQKIQEGLNAAPPPPFKGQASIATNPYNHFSNASQNRNGQTNQKSGIEKIQEQLNAPSRPL